MLKMLDFTGFATCQLTKCKVQLVVSNYSFLYDYRVPRGTGQQSVVELLTGIRQNNKRVGKAQGGKYDFSRQDY